MKRNLIHRVATSLVVLSSVSLSLAQVQSPYRLSLREAIDKGLQANLSVLVADTRVQELEGTRVRRLANLLPKVRAQSYANLQNRNLRAFGISFPGVPEVVGPFSNYDFRIYADQSVVDLQSYRNWKAADVLAESGKLDYQNARDLVIRSIASLYLSGQAAAARVEAAQSRVTASGALYRLAKDRHVPTVVLDLDHTFESRELIARFSATPYFDVQQHLYDRRQIADLLDRGKATLALHIHPGFAEELRKGQTAPLQIIVDGTNSNTALIATGYANQIAQGFAADYQRDHMIRARSCLLWTTISRTRTNRT